MAASCSGDGAAACSDSEDHIRRVAGVVALKKAEAESNIFFFFFSVLYSALLHLPPLRFHCADGCWDRTQDRCKWCIDSQTL
jgi:hypothetical protein